MVVEEGEPGVVGILLVCLRGDVQSAKAFLFLPGPRCSADAEEMEGAVVAEDRGQAREHAVEVFVGGAVSDEEQVAVGAVAGYEFGVVWQCEGVAVVDDVDFVRRDMQDVNDVLFGFFRDGDDAFGPVGEEFLRAAVGSFAGKASGRISWIMSWMVMTIGVLPAYSRMPSSLVCVGWMRL